MAGGNRNGRVRAGRWCPAPGLAARRDSSSSRRSEPCRNGPGRQTCARSRRWVFRGRASEPGRGRCDRSAVAAGSRHKQSDVTPREPLVVGRVADSDPALGGQHQPVAPAPFGRRPAADNFLSEARRLGLRRDRVRVCRVDERHALFVCLVKDLPRRRLIGLPGERHRSQADIRDLEPRPAHPPLLHGVAFLPIDDLPKRVLSLQVYRPGRGFPRFGFAPENWSGLQTSGRQSIADLSVDEYRA